MSESAFLTSLVAITGRTASLGDLVRDASALTEQGESGLAEQLYKVWIGLNAGHAQAFVAHFNLSGLQSAAGDIAGAIASLEAAVASNPDFAPAYINLGGLLERTGELDRAMAQWTTVVNKPAPINGQAAGYVQAALRQMSRMLMDHHRLAAAEAGLRQSLDINPNDRDVVEQYLAMRLGQCEWPTVVPWEGATRKALMAGFHPLSMAAYTDDPLLQLACARQFCERTAGQVFTDNPSDRRHAKIDLTGRRLRVGYVSSDLRDHAVGYLMAELWELHDKAAIEVFVYYCGPEPKGRIHDRARDAIEHWTSIRDLTDDQAAAAIAADAVDILIDVNGHTRDARLGVFSRRPAPIQVNWLGFPGSIGSPFHHYIIGDDFITPPGCEAWYSEKVLRLPCYQPNDRQRLVAAERPSRRDAGLPDDAFVFCSFNAAQKFTRFTFDRWIEILVRTPGSVLWLLESTPETQKHLSEYAEARGVAAGRLIFAPKQGNPNHLARYPLADLFLDTLPYGAHTTASDALWMGVPLLTLAGRCFASRVCGSLVRAAGLPDLVVDTPQAFVEKAVALAADKAGLAALRARLEAGRDHSVLFDMDLLVSRLEGLYRGMVEDQQQGRLPKPDLTNLETYLAVGILHDHEVEEVVAIADYEGWWKAKLALHHRHWPLPPDSRLWTAEDITRAEAGPTEAPVLATSEPPILRRARTGGA
jgi:predicted O-linked N-acetylglucosamine transferase (SPINDLY family)